MCFSATASLSTAALTGLIGVASILRVRHARELPLAAVPLLFATQQAIEGGLWLIMPASPNGVWASGLTLLYLLFAQVFWPVYAPVAAWSLETDRCRKRLMLGLMGLGAAVAAFLLWRLLGGPREAVIVNRCIVYHTDSGNPLLVGALYLLASTAPLLLSTRRTIFSLGVIVLTGSVVAYLFYWQAFQSVWCYFAAAGSAVIFAHFETSRRWGAQPAAG